MQVDATISGLNNAVQYPLTYGYCSVGEVTATGDKVDPQWLGRRVFAFHPHTSAFHCDPASLIAIPDDLSYEQAVFLPNMETAVNFALDARPLIGETVVVIGLGVVGLLTSFVLQKFPLARLLAFDGYANRRACAVGWGIEAFGESGDMQGLDPDLILELSSNPAALNLAIQLARFGTRIVIGSWYGDKEATLPLGGHFHRNRVQLISSQVSTIDGQFSNRWTKSRRINTALTHLKSLPVNDLITHRLPISAASEAYQLIDQHPEQTIQVLFTY
jgi:threonine dehydrogenase-like Zn-dependent dehydrogenase